MKPLLDKQQEEEVYKILNDLKDMRTTKEIADSFGVSARTLTRTRKKLDVLKGRISPERITGPRLSPEEKEAIYEAMQAGTRTIEDIAREFGICSGRAIRIQNVLDKEKGKIRTGEDKALKTSKLGTLKAEENEDRNMEIYRMLNEDLVPAAKVGIKFNLSNSRIFQIQKRIDKKLGVVREVGKGNSSKRAAKRKKIEMDITHNKPNFAEIPSQKVDPVEMLKAAAARVKFNRDLKPPDYNMVTIQTDQPIAIMKSADWHFGGIDIDYESLLAHLQFLWDTPNFYLQLFGDDLNMMMMFRNVSSRTDVFTVEEQIIWLENIIDKTLESGKLVSMGWGNHSDEFSERNAGFGIVERIAKHKVPYFRGLGYLDLVVGKQTYPMAFAHKSRFSSFMNPVHGNIRMRQLHSHLFGVNSPIAKEYITGHTHSPAFMVENCIPSERIYYIKCGTFKTDCTYSQRYYGQGKIGVPTVVYRPDVFEHVCFATPWEAHTYMKGLKASA
jgi:transposase-like protein